MSETLNSTVKYNRAFSVVKSLLEKGVLSIEVCNNALVGIAKELGVLNPILL